MLMTEKREVQTQTGEGDEIIHKESMILETDVQKRKLYL